jgi:amylosucrase
MPEIFPESAPGNFTYNKELKAWVMTVFHQYQWDLNYSNPNVLVAMLDTIFFYANIGVDILRIDAPAFIWKQLGTTCQNLPQAHTLLRLIKHCVQMASPGMALLGEAIVAPDAIMQYFGEGTFTARECDVAYNATQMALQWDALATGDTRVMLQAQPILLQKPTGTTWLTYTRCHDDIGLGYDDAMIANVGFNPYEHRKFLKNWYSGVYPGTYAKGALFSVNPKTQDARISGTLASLCGLENAILNQQKHVIQQALQRIILMQAHSMFLGGIPMLFYGDEVGYTNDYSYLHDAGKSYDNRWMHRPIIDWKKNALRNEQGTIEQQLFTAMQQLIIVRKQYKAFADYSNLIWLTPHNKHIAGFVRQNDLQTLFCFFNFSSYTTELTWYVFKELPHTSFTQVKDIANGTFHNIGPDHEHLVFPPYSWMIFEGISD